MIKIKTLLIISICGLSLIGHSQSAVTMNPLQYVNTFLGVDNWGNVFPGAALPFSMVNVSPDIADKQPPSGYLSNKPIIGFSHNHQSGCGMNRGHGNILVMPQVGALNLHPKEMVKDEIASPGYYAATFAESGIRAEVSLSARCGVHLYTFKKGQKARILLDVTATRLAGQSK
ncbi:MAG: hypothetical protein PF489_03295 [Salinivirgaceae bacterium]|nr:hypothetical protein [Salinivirgaceae bacterium]